MKKLLASLVLASSIFCLNPVRAEVLPDCPAQVTFTGKSIMIGFPGWDPAPLMPPACGSSECKRSQLFTVDLGRNYRLLRLQAFKGVNKGDEFEYGFTIVLEDGTLLYTESWHKEASDNFDAYAPLVSFPSTKIRRFSIHVSAQNSHKTQAGQPHFGIILTVE